MSRKYSFEFLIEYGTLFCYEYFFKVSKQIWKEIQTFNRIEHKFSSLPGNFLGNFDELWAKRGFYEDIDIVKE